MLLPALGNSRMTGKQGAKVLQRDPFGWQNEQRRSKNAALPREKVMSRIAGAFDNARRAIETIEDYGAPGPYGPIHTKGQWLQRIVDHVDQHLHDLELLLGS